MAVNFEKHLFTAKNMINLFLLIFLCFQFGESAKLSVPRILLPYNTGVPTNYTLEVKEGGCYKWSSSRYDLVTVTPLPSDRERASCTTKAIVSAVSRYPERENAIILVEDEKSGQILRCDIVIDSVHSVEIITTTRVLFLEDAPEAFEVVAKNDQGDTFTSLAGVAFQWSLESDSLASDAYGVLRFLKFADSVYKTPPSVEYWEKQNLHGSMILMEGSKTGSAKVTVKPLDPAYKHVASYDVSLVVVANLNLKPAHTYVLPGTKVKYQLELIKQGKAFPISLPSDQYYLEVADKSVATLNEAVAIVTALKYGTTNIVVKDRYISGREIAYLPSAVIHVTPPSYLTLSVSPGDKWSLEEKKDYSVLVSVYDRNSHPIYLTEEVRVAIQFPQKYFLVKMSSSNGTYQEIRTLIPGSTVINAHLLGIAKKDGSIMRIEPTVSASQDVIIYESIKVHPSQTLLPWDPISKPVYSIFLKATGGTGVFNWMSGDTALASVHAVYEQEETIARVSTFGLGTFTVHAIDAHIPAFNGSGQVSIQPVVDLEILPKEVEVELNSTLILPVAMYGYLPDNKTKMFSNCSQVSISVVIDEIQKFIHEKDISSVVKPSACRNIHLKCIAKGFNRIRVRYERDDISLKKAAVVACYRKLKVVHPIGEAVIAIGSSLDIILEGGPQPWPRCQSHFVNLSPEHESIDMSVLRNDSDISDIHKVYAFCRNFGEGAFTLKVGNKPCDSNPHPAVNQALIRVLCAIPESLTLRPILPAIQGKKCPVSGDNRIAIHSAENVDLELIVKDSYGREFHNISSLDVKWYVSDSSLAHLSSSTGVKTKLVKLKDMQYKIRYYQHLQPYGTEGDLKITASISGYKQNLNIDESIYDEKFTTINSSVNFILVEEAEVEPKKASVFNSPSSKVYLNVTKGSGHFQVEASDPSKAEVLYNSATNQIEITPLETGSITITINDLCLGIVHRAVAEVQIYGISAVVVDVLDKVELGKTIIASVEVLNEDKQRIPASVFTLMNLQAVSTSEIVSVNLFSKPEPHQFQALYSIKGLSLGHTNFKVITKANIFKGVQYSSITYPIQVFPPLDLNPDHIILVVGATFQVLCSGGPQPQSNIEYSIDDSDIAVVSACGTVEAKKVGKTAVIARAVGLDKKGNTVVYSEDKTLVSCVSLKEVKIHAPLSRMVAGTEMPLYAVGHTELESPFTFGTAAPSAKFKWSVSNDKVASINTVYSSVGLQESSSNNFRVVLKALQDGLVTVRLEVTLPKETSISFLGGSQILSAEIQIQVFKRLRLTNPEVEDGMIIMSPNSQLKLKCNRLGIAKISYKVLESTNKVNLAPVISVDESGTLFASSKLGSSILQVTAVEEFRITQDLSVIVKVEETAYLMLKPIGTIMTRDWPLTVLPVGFTVPFVVTYHNNIGQIFDAVRSHLQYRASRPNSARVSFGTLNNTLSVQVVKPGFTVLKVWDVESSIPPDYIQILTGTAIDPADIELTVGDVICFGSPLVTQEGHSGVWSSSKAILAVHPISGGAVALNAGQAVVIYSLLNGFSTSTTVTVKDAAYISIEPGNVNQISNLPRSKPYKIYIVIQSNETHRINNLVGKNCTSATENSMPLPLVPAPFSCELNFLSSSADISVNDLFHSSSGFDIEKGMYFCSIEPVGKIPLNEASTLEGQLSLTVHLLSVEPTGLLSQQLLSFMPAFHVQQDELILSDIQNINHVIVSATPAVQRCLLIVPSDPTVLRVKPPVLHPIFPASVTFQVDLHDVNFLLKGDLSPLYVEISCPITKQQVKIPVRIKRLEVPLDGNAYCQPLPLPPATEFYYDWYLIMKIAAASLCIIIVFYFIRWLTSARRGIVTSQPVFLHSTSSNGSQSFSPTHRSFTPSPFRQRYSPSSELENLSQPMRLCHLETSPKSLQRRRVDNVFR